MFLKKNSDNNNTLVQFVPEDQDLKMTPDQENLLKSKFSQFASEM